MNRDSIIGYYSQESTQRAILLRPRDIKKVEMMGMCYIIQHVEYGTKKQNDVRKELLICPGSDNYKMFQDYLKECIPQDK